MKMQNLPRSLWAIIGFFLLGIVVITIGAFLLFQYIRNDFLTVDWGPPAQRYTIPQNDDFQELWTRSIFADCMTCVIATDGSVYLVGTLQSRGLMSLNRLDLLTGEIQWQTTLPSASAALLTSNSQYVLVSTPGGKVASPTQAWDTARLIAYDIATGDQVWSEQIPGTRGLRTAYFIDESVYALGGYDRAYQLETESGQILNKSRLELLASQDEQANYFLEFDGLRAVDSNTGETLWFYEGSVYPPPQFVEEIIVAGGGQRNLLGSAIALDRQSGDVLWKYENVVSNIAVSDSTVFFLKMDENAVWDGKYISDVQLLAVDRKTGTLMTSMQFDPPSLSFGNRSYQYNVAVCGDIVLIHLADGRQLIALRFSPGK